MGELLFDGYEDPILKIGASFNKEKRTVPIDRFGWFYKVRSRLESPDIKTKFRGMEPAGLTAS